MQAGEQLLSRILFAPSIFFYDEEARLLHSLVGGEAVLAARVEALAPTAYDIIVVA